MGTCLVFRVLQSECWKLPPIPHAFAFALGLCLLLLLLPPLFVPASPILWIGWFIGVAATPRNTTPQHNHSSRLDWTTIDFQDNQPVIDLVSKKPRGLLIQLEEQGLLGRRANNKALLQVCGRVFGVKGYDRVFLFLSPIMCLASFETAPDI